jgi:hypothetical protein
MSNTPRKRCPLCIAPKPSCFYGPCPPSLNGKVPSCKPRKGKDAGKAGPSKAPRPRTSKPTHVVGDSAISHCKDGALRPPDPQVLIHHHTRPRVLQLHWQLLAQPPHLQGTAHGRRGVYVWSLIPGAAPAGQLILELLGSTACPVAMSKKRVVRAPTSGAPSACRLHGGSLTGIPGAP